MWRASEGQNQLRISLFTLTTKLVEVCGARRGVAPEAGHEPSAGLTPPGCAACRGAACPQALQESSLSAYEFAVPLVQFACNSGQVRPPSEPQRDRGLGDERRPLIAHVRGVHGACTVGRRFQQQAGTFLEDGLDLWRALAKSAPTAAPDALWAMFPTLCDMLGLQGEVEFQTVVEIFQSYLLLDPRPDLIEARCVTRAIPSDLPDRPNALSSAPPAP